MKIFNRVGSRKNTNIQLYNISVALTQIYGEMNRMRLITSDHKRAKNIEKFDKENNNYAPFFGSEKARKEYNKNANS